jgi:hypothetical protein
MSGSKGLMKKFDFSKKKKDEKRVNLELADFCLFD